MKQFAKRVSRVFSSRFPVFYYNLIQRPRLFFLFGKEKQLARGVELSKNSHPSIIFFTTQKCASRYVSEILAQLAQSAGMVHADYDAYITMIGVPKEKNPFRSDGTLDIAFKLKGYYYGPIGTYRAIPNLDKYKLLLQLRDPRDMLTSLYFSTAFSHAIISPKLIRRRTEALQTDIDDFVLHSASEYLPIYQTYCEKLLSQSNALFVKYEDMVANFDDWLNSLSQHLGLTEQSEDIEIIKSSSDFSVSVEDKYAQRRQVSPGDHLRKLKPETISQLNTIFGDVLRELKFTI